MPLNAAFYSTWTPRAQALLRIVTAYLFLTHGASKLLGIPHTAAFGGGVLLLLGLFTRPVAFILCGEMAFAYFIGHASRGQVLVPMLNRGELAVLYCFVFLFFASAGAGAWSLDAVRRRPATA